jgi:cell division protein FtsB
MKPRKKKKERTKEINRERWWTNREQNKQTHKKNSRFRNNRILVLVVLALLF